VKTNGKALEDLIQMDGQMIGSYWRAQINELLKMFQDRKEHFPQRKGLSKLRQLKNKVYLSDLGPWIKQKSKFQE